MRNLSGPGLVRAIAAGAALGLVAGCGASDAIPDPADARASGASAGLDASTFDASTYVLGADPELRAIAADLLPGLTARSGLELVAPVRVERRSRPELERYLLHKLDEELGDERARHLAESYRLLGLISPGADLRALLLDVYREQVAGFYDPDSTALFVLDDQPREAVESLLLHELVHAVQDQSVDLDALTDPALGNDRRMAAQAAIEGHATLVMLEFMFERGGAGAVDLAEVPELAGQLRPALEEARTQYPALAAAPAIVQEGLLFPYVEGASYVLEVWRRGEARGSVLGERLPRSTEQVLDPGRLLGSEPDVPHELSVRSVSPAHEIVFEETLGQAELRVLLRAWGLDPSLAEGWGGDRFALVSHEPGFELVLATLWDAPGPRDAFAEAVSSALDGPGRPSQVERLEIDGRPATLVTRAAAAERGGAAGVGTATEPADAADPGPDPTPGAILEWRVHEPAPPAGGHP